MGRYRKIDVRIWNDAKFRELSDRGKLVFFFLLTHPHMTSLGAMRASINGMASELGWPEKAFREAFREALAKGMAEHDETTCFVGLPNFIKYNPPESPNVVKSWLQQLDLIPECDSKTLIIKRVKAFAEGFGEGFRKAFAEIEKALAKGMPNPEQEHEHEQEPEQDTPKPPSDVQELLDVWNHTPGIVKAAKLTTKRATAAKARLADPDWAWRQALSKFPLKCTTSNEGGWLPDLDWFLKPDTVIRILEGKYDWSKSPNGQQPKPNSTAYDPNAAGTFE